MPVAYSISNLQFGSIRGGFKVLITGPHGLEGSVHFVVDENPAVITAHIRAALDN